MRTTGTFFVLMVSLTFGPGATSRPIQMDTSFVGAAP
jgi:hypothetical protein